MADEKNLNEEEEMTVTLTLDDDSEIECVVLNIFSAGDREYIALLPEEDETVLIYQYKELDDEEFELLTIEDDDEFDKVSSAFDSLFNDEDEEEE